MLNSKKRTAQDVSYYRFTRDRIVEMCALVDAGSEDVGGHRGRRFWDCLIRLS